MFRKTLKTAVGAFNKVCNLLLGIVMVAMFLVLLLQIISRFIARSFHCLGRRISSYSC